MAQWPPLVGGFFPSPQQESVQVARCGPCGVEQVPGGLVRAMRGTKIRPATFSMDPRLEQPTLRISYDQKAGTNVVFVGFLERLVLNGAFLQEEDERIRSLTNTHSILRDRISRPPRGLVV